MSLTLLNFRNSAIGFLILKNVGIDTKIKPLGILEAEISEEKVIFLISPTAILEKTPYRDNQ